MGKVRAKSQRIRISRSNRGQSQRAESRAGRTGNKCLCSSGIPRVRAGLAFRSGWRL